MKKTPKKPVELCLDFTVFNPPNNRKKRIICTPFELIEPRPTLSFSKIPKCSKVSFSPSSRPYLQKPEIPSSVPSSHSQIQSLVTHFSLKSDPLFQQQHSFYSQVQQDCLDILNSGSFLEESPQLHSWYLKYCQKFIGKLEKSLKHNQLIHTQQLNNLKTYYKDQLAKYKALKRILDLCTSKSRPFDRLNSHCHSILNENLDLKKELRISKAFE